MQYLIVVILIAVVVAVATRRRKYPTDPRTGTPSEPGSPDRNQRPH